MTDTELEATYKIGCAESHVQGLRAVADAAYKEATTPYVQPTVPYVLPTLPVKP